MVRTKSEPDTLGAGWLNKGSVPKTHRAANAIEILEMALLVGATYGNRPLDLYPARCGDDDGAGERVIIATQLNGAISMNHSTMDGRLLPIGYYLSRVPSRPRASSAA